MAKSIKCKTYRDVYEWAAKNALDGKFPFPVGELTLKEQLIFGLGIFAGEEKARGKWDLAESVKKQSSSDKPDAFKIVVG